MKVINRSVPPPVPKYYDNKMNCFLGTDQKQGFSFKRSNKTSLTAAPKEIKNKVLNKDVV